MKSIPLEPPCELTDGGPIHHRPPILCVDRILEFSAEHALCEYEVREGGHVRDGAMWEEGLLEGLAQSAAVLQSLPSGATVEGVGMLVGIRKFVIQRAPVIGELVQWRVDLIKRLGPFMLTDCRALSGEECFARGELKFYWEVQG